MPNQDGVDSGFHSAVAVLCPLQLNNPTLVEGLVLINVDPCAEGWIDWAASKVGGLTSRHPRPLLHPRTHLPSPLSHLWLVASLLKS